MEKTLFIVSDVHGHFTLLKKALDNAGFDPQNQAHLLICCGDYFDRGNENAEVLRFFERLQHKVLLRGNHEDLLLEVLQNGQLWPHNYLNGTLTTLKNFFGEHCVDFTEDTVDLSGHSRTVDRLCDFIHQTTDYFETEHYVFVHGWITNRGRTAEGRKAATEHEWRDARWVKWTERYTGEKPLQDKILVCGHVPSFYASSIDPSRAGGDTDPYIGNGLIAIDGGTFSTGVVNVCILQDNLHSPT